MKKGQRIVKAFYLEAKEQLENMSLQDKERVVASVALLDAFTKEVQNKVEEITEEISVKQ